MPTHCPTGVSLGLRGSGVPRSHELSTSASCGLERFTCSTTRVFIRARDDAKSRTRNSTTLQWQRSAHLPLLDVPSANVLSRLSVPLRLPDILIICRCRGFQTVRDGKATPTKLATLILIGVTSLEDGLAKERFSVTLTKERLGEESGAGAEKRKEYG